ncbi:MAG: ATP-binding protein [Synechococcus sp. SB0668_bin_15]|nr:ATP-binding protein [Synechococcus sp. SB0668_bin_15]MYC50620.1 ATP-binding protein [Synechococcus sp. SB0662_bin_14]
MGRPENEHPEFKEAQGNFDHEKLFSYCVALANEGGGNLVLGVTDRQPRLCTG